LAVKARQSDDAESQRQEEGALRSPTQTWSRQPLEISANQSIFSRESVRPAANGPCARVRACALCSLSVVRRALSVTRRRPAKEERASRRGETLAPLARSSGASLPFPSAPFFPPQSAYYSACQPYRREWTRPKEEKVLFSSCAREQREKRKFLPSPSRKKGGLWCERKRDTTAVETILWPPKSNHLSFFSAERGRHALTRRGKELEWAMAASTRASLTTAAALVLCGLILLPSGEVARLREGI